MSSDEYDDIDEEDFLHAISQVSQPNPTSPRPAKRRRVSLQNDSISDSNSNPSSASHRKSSTSRKKRSLSIEADQSAGDASEKPAKEPKKKKPKHLIHIPKVHKEFKETYSYGTQADGEPGSSPYLARGAIWKIPRPPPGAETRQMQPSTQKKAPTLDSFFKPTALKEIPSNKPLGKPGPLEPKPTVVLSDDDADDFNQNISFPPSRAISGEKSVSPLGRAPLRSSNIVSSRQKTISPPIQVSVDLDLDDFPSDFENEVNSPIKPTASSNAISAARQSTGASGPSDADFARELAEIGSDFWSSSAEQPEITGQRLVAPQNNLRQTTLFGDKVAQASFPASQVNMARQYRVDIPPEAPTHHKINLEAMKTWVYPTNLGEIRPYQYSIVKTGLFSNTLVALPTGLGKTFIAATIMLNFFRWTTDAQIVFMAPTKPLVTQQVNACFNIVGIPRSMTTMLNGEVSKELREEAWLEKRVFFVTPQTFENDLRSGLADPKRIVLMVIDEAHRGTGKYAYVKCVEAVRRFNTSFRVLALTATPGSTVEKVQEVVDNLEIAKVEIRTEASIDIRPFCQPKVIEEIILQPSGEMNEVSSLFSKAVQPLMNIMCAQKAYYNKDPMSINNYTLLMGMKEWTTSPAGRAANEGVKFQIRAVGNILSSLAHSVELLKYHGLIPFYANMRDFREQVDDKGEKGSKFKKQIANSGEFKEMMNYLQMWSDDPDFVGHPKIPVVCETILNHFMNAGAGTDAAEASTRVMVFSQYRDSAEVLVEQLLKHRPMIKPSIFVGQADSKRSAGMKQSKQSEVVADFKNGKYNVLVATSIGEEGLDIGEVDLIICYDASASPIRMLQRMGRTGRKRAGKIVCVMMEGKEHEKIAKAKDNYEKMQELISSGKQFAFRTDLSTRIVPKGTIPEVDKRDVEIPFENTQNPSLPLPKAKPRGAKKKRADKKFHMPDGVVTGFQKASNLGAESSTAASKTRKPRRTRAEIMRDRELLVDEQTPIPIIDSVFLTADKEKELERCYQNVGHAWDLEVVPPDLTRYPQQQRSLRPALRVGHGRATKDFVSTLQRMHNVPASVLDKWKHIHDTYPDPAKEVGDEMQGEEEEEGTPEEDLIMQSMADEDEESDEETSHTQRHAQSSGVHGSIALGSDTEGEDPIEDSDGGLSDIVVNDGFGNKSIASSVIESSPIAVRKRSPLKPFYQALQLPSTQDSDDELPDFAPRGNENDNDNSQSQKRGNEAVRARGRKRPLRQIIDDSDE